MTTTIKTCFKCKVEKPVTDFYVHPAMGDGRLNKCKECTKKDVSENYRANSDHYREYERTRFTTSARKERLRIYQQNRRIRNPEKETARRKFSRAIKAGQIIRPSICSKCGSAGKIEGHHHDYKKPLDVVWLCFMCHREEHGQEAVWQGVKTG